MSKQKYDIRLIWWETEEKFNILRFSQQDTSIRRAISKALLDFFNCKPKRKERARAHTKIEILATRVKRTAAR